MASESAQRTTNWLKYGCNAFDKKDRQTSQPLSFWTEQDILEYLYTNKIPIAKVYGDVVKTGSVGQKTLSDEFPEEMGMFDIGKPIYETTGVPRTGCMFCMYGVQYKDNADKLVSMKSTHPQLYDYIMKPESEGGLGYKEKIDWINQNSKLKIKY